MAAKGGNGMNRKAFFKEARARVCLEAASDKGSSRDTGRSWGKERTDGGRKK